MTALAFQLLMQRKPEYFDAQFSAFHGENKLAHLTEEQILQGAALFILLTDHKPYHQSQIIRALANVLNVP